MDKESTKWIRFLGGKNLLYTLTILCLIAVTIFLFNTVSFIFKPINRKAGQYIIPKTNEAMT